MKEIRELTLNIDENTDETVYRLHKGWVLRFVLGASLHTKNVRLFCNHPSKSDVDFDRTYHKELGPWVTGSSMKVDRNDYHIDMRVHLAGNFSYFFTIDGSERKPANTNCGYFIIDPTLRVGPPNEQTEITMDCLCIQTVLTKSLGPIDGWERRLLVAKHCGYNMVHFTPIHELGISRSAYSIKDHSRLEPTYNTACGVASFTDVGDLVKRMEYDWRVLSMCDLVFNHAAINSEWIIQHPQSVYNLHNSPHLRPGYLVDRIYCHFNKDVGRGVWTERGVSPCVKHEDQLNKMRDILLNDVFPKYKLSEFYTVEEEEILNKFDDAIKANLRLPADLVEGKVEIQQDSRYRRLMSTIDIDNVLKHFHVDQPGEMTNLERIRIARWEFINIVNHLNDEKKAELNEHLRVSVENYLANIRYRFLAADGQQLEHVTKDTPLMWNYFIIPKIHEGSLAQEEIMMDKEGQFVMATNGWVMGDDPLRGFADPGPRDVYLRRELISWGDSVKLRYGKTPADAPFLWEYMKKYAVQTARIFHGVRLDNCHTTPLHVAEYMMDAARKVRPDLYVVAELFTGNDAIDNLFINTLGINSLIREGMRSQDAHDLGRQVQRYGGSSVGSFIQPNIQPIAPTVAHALLYDQTHDNMSTIQTHSVYNVLPLTALVAMAHCAIGSNRGYDELVPHHIHVVEETRAYMSWSTTSGDLSVSAETGIIEAKNVFNELHQKLSQTGYKEIFVDQVDSNTVCVTRHNPRSHESVILVARMAYSTPSDISDQGNIPPLTVPGTVIKILFEARLMPTNSSEFSESPKFINGLKNFRLHMREDIAVNDSVMVHIDAMKDGGESKVSFIGLTPGSVVAFQAILPTDSKQAILEIRKGIKQFGFLVRTYSGRTLTENKATDFRGIVKRLSLNDLNHVLYRTDGEERDNGNGFGVYHVPNYGGMIFCGLQGLISMLAKIRPANDLGHPLCKNLRNGDWFPTYIYERLKMHKGTKELSHWFEKLFAHLSKVPRYLIPSYFDAVVTGAYMVLRDQALSHMSQFIQDGSTFVHELAMVSVQLCGVVMSSKLPPLSQSVQPMVLPDDEMFNEVPIRMDNTYASLAAGLPHFTNGIMRNWGRDTFVAARGLLLVTGRYSDARCLILSYAGTLRHGLIPNLLGEGTHARYNSRDAVWWWLQLIQEYCKMTPQGEAILADMVVRMYPSDVSEPQHPGDMEQPLLMTIQEAMQRHAESTTFIERNAGPKIDDHMTMAGFENSIGVDWSTGFVFGGNIHNCGTWMDKMGSSHRAGNAGKPSTPRDGSAIELVGMCKSTLRWLISMRQRGLYPFTGVTVCKAGEATSSKSEITFAEWDALITANFEEHFWVPELGEQTHKLSNLVSRHGIYKDTHKASIAWADYQFRPNFAVAMVVAPELFTPSRAWKTLKYAYSILLGPLGMKTLDPNDLQYVGDYYNTETNEYKTSNGLNYHCGPEWVWLTGYFLRAYLYFAKLEDHSYPGTLSESIIKVNEVLTRLNEHILTSPWHSLPELTNKNGSRCDASCESQAWSAGCIQEVLYDLETSYSDTPTCRPQ